MIFLDLLQCKLDNWNLENFKFLLTQALSDGPSTAHIEVVALISLYTDILNWELSTLCPCVDNMILGRLKSNE